MATLLHALAALVLGNFRFASFFERAHFRFASRDSTIYCAALQLTSLLPLLRAPSGVTLNQSC
jgi:hypothetical protein